MSDLFPLAPLELTDAHCQVMEYVSSGGPMLDGDIIDHLRLVEAADTDEAAARIIADLRELELIATGNLRFDGQLIETVYATGLGAVITGLNGIQRVERSQRTYGGYLEPSGRSGSQLYCPRLHWVDVTVKWHRARAKRGAKAKG